MERLYRGFDIITNPVHTSNQQRQIFNSYFDLEKNGKTNRQGAFA
ncbi:MULTISPECIES: hypothetical protein [Cyanophyceae]|nr:MULTISPECIES: hypothetical protein [Cyanophyceae]MDB9330030.1 hypothetical protein [Nodularia spumigena CS-591/04]MDB9306052.1 hypothetical protein [Nodularia spumigena CS-591/12]MDB9319611.1 hypothetical protein [Nodularia spumigena CS-590/01A]MDB9322114.1 hypothetical protein [Nodularia spumigena CS-591/07A]MDB9337510.1 hypothetical protein [Nodularia spumigena CS-590/01]